MPRIPYLPADLRDPTDLVDAIRARRGGALLNLDRALLHSPPLARGWNAFLGAIRSELGLAPKLRELVTCAVAALNGARYELHHHGPIFLRAGGTETQLAALARGDVDGPVFDELERAVLRLVRETTRDVSVRDSTFAAVRERLGDRGTLELVAIAAAYNMVSRVLVALDIEPE